jgi:GAF domain-containing protein
MFDANELIHELQEMRDQGHLSDRLLREAVKAIVKADERFDWVGVYLLNEADQELWLHNYVGATTEHAKIPVGQGVCGTAVSEKANQIVNDVSTVEDNPACSPYVQAEMVVLVRAGDEIFGQFDIGSDQKDAFTEEDETALQGIADKLAEQIAAERR